MDTIIRAWVMQMKFHWRFNLEMAARFPVELAQ